MTRGLVTWTILTGILLQFLVHATGCSVIGYAAGSATDRRNAAKARKQPNEIPAILIGTSITLFTVNGERLVGKYAGLVSIESGDMGYSHREFAEADRSTEPLPRIGDQVIVTHSGERELECIFEGIRDGYIFLQPLGERLVWPLELERVRNLVGPTGLVVEGGTLALVPEGKLAPYRLAVSIRNDAEVTQAAFEDISEVVLPFSSNRRIQGLIGGALFDAAAVVAYIWISNGTIQLGPSWN